MLSKLARHLKKYNLTNSEIDCAIQIFTGHSLKSISANRFTTTGSTKAHLSNIYKKLYIKNRYELMHFCNYFLFADYRLMFYKSELLESLLIEEPDQTSFKQTELYKDFILPKGRD
jgi:DNA-binding CsgD family transcriptional regulator